MTVFISREAVITKYSTSKTAPLFLKSINKDVAMSERTLLGMNRPAVQWFRSYLTMCTQSVCTNGVLSEPKPLSFGVPQGSVLGPWLFIIYRTNDLPLALQGCSVELYADDTLVYFASNSVSEIQVQLSSGLTNVLSWLHANFLILKVGVNVNLSELEEV